MAAASPGTLGDGELTGQLFRGAGVVAEVGVAGDGVHNFS